MVHCIQHKAAGAAANATALQGIHMFVQAQSNCMFVFVDEEERLYENMLYP